MFRKAGYLIMLLGLIGMISKTGYEYRYIPNECYTRGERILFKLHYGFINAGEAEMRIDQDIHLVNNRPCYKIDILGYSVGVFDMMLRIRDTWGSYLDTAAIISQRSYRYIEEGRYRKNEMINFDHSRQVAVLNKLDKHTKELVEKVEYQIPENVQDLVSGYYYLRTIDYNSLPEGTKIKVTGFFDKELYHMEIKYLGKERLKTKLGHYDALVMSPVMPDNKMFDGENSIKVWLSDDQYKIPLKIKAKMFVGAVEVDIIEYQKGTE